MIGGPIPAAPPKPAAEGAAANARRAREKPRAQKGGTRSTPGQRLLRIAAHASLESPSDRVALGPFSLRRRGLLRRRNRWRRASERVVARPANADRVKLGFPRFRYASGGGSGALAVGACA